MVKSTPFGLIGLLLVSLSTMGQYIPLDNYYYGRLTEKCQKDNIPVFISMKPILLQDIDTSYHIEEALYPLQKSKSGRGSLLFRKLFNESLITYKEKDLSITVDPLFNFGVGHDSKASKSTWINSRGISLTGLINKNISFNTEIIENQAVFPSWPTSFIKSNKIIPGQGLYKPFKTTDGFDYFYSSGYLSYNQSKHINLTLGYGKNFIGEGYRSMLLSDASYNYPYLKLTTNFKNVKYTVLYEQFVDHGVAQDADFGYNKKWSTIHYLQVMLWKRLNIGLFDALIWENADSTGYRGFDVQYLNPVILLRPIEESNGSPDNALMGTTMSFRVNKHINIYGQLLLDEFKLSHMKARDGWWGNNNGYQIGISGWNLLNIPSLDARVEYNQARPFTYAHGKTIESYSNYGQPLAHPLGANFREVVAMASYSKGNWIANLKLNYAMYGLDTAGKDFGGNIFIPYGQHVMEYGNKIGQGLKTHLTTADASLAYLLNRRTNLRIEVGMTDRMEKNDKWDKEMQYFYFGIKTGLRNLYSDF